MAKKNIQRIFLGIVLIIFSIAGVAAIYFLEAKPRFWVQRPVGLGEDRLPALPMGHEPAPLAADIHVHGNEPAVDVEHPSQVASAVGVNDLDKKEGFLWVDRKSSQLIVTLGKLSGISQGRQLIVYEGANRLGEVVVDMDFETVSYVHAVGKFMDLLENTYYRVGME